MIRYFTLPAEPFALHDPSTDDPVYEPAKDADGKPIANQFVPSLLTHANVFRTILQDPRLKAEMDACDIYDLRRKLTGPFGTSVELSEEEHKVLVPLLRRPATATTQGVLTILSEGALASPGVIRLFRSVIDAKSEKPA